jgi:hypothetical protein
MQIYSAMKTKVLIVLFFILGVVSIARAQCSFQGGASFFL